MMIPGFCRASVAGSLTVYATLATLLGNPLYAAESSPSATFEMPPAVAITIDSENLIELYQSVPDLRIVDARYREDYVLGHIELSRNLPMDQTDCRALSKITANKDTAIVFYCNGVEGGASIEAIQLASACGYRRLFWLRGGFIEWQNKDYPFAFE
jgi:rhodanese-related sulfurtransferase